MGLCVSLAHETSTIPYWTSIQPIYYSHPVEAANTAAHIHEVSGGRFRFGIGVSHGPVTSRLGVETGKPLSDIRHYVEAMRANERFGGQLPPVYLATLRNKMLELAAEVSGGPSGRTRLSVACRPSSTRSRQHVRRRGSSWRTWSPP